MQFKYSGVGRWAGDLGGSGSFSYSLKRGKVAAKLTGLGVASASASGTKGQLGLGLKGLHKATRKVWFPSLIYHAKGRGIGGEAGPLAR